MSRIASIEEDTKAPKVTPAEQAAALEQLRRELYGEERTRIGTGVAVLATVLIHILLLLALPYLAKIANDYSGAPTGIWSPVYEVKYEDVAFLPDTAQLPEAMELPQNFVETNPDVPENKPDETQNFSSRDQQSAQPEPATFLSDDNSPQIKAEDMQPDSPKILEGELSNRDNEPRLAPGRYVMEGPDAASPSDASEQEYARTEQTAPVPSAPAVAPDALKLDRDTPLDGDGLASYLDPLDGETYPEETFDTKTDTISITPMNPIMAEQLKNRSATVTAPAQNAEGRPSPLPRPRIVPKVAPGPLRETPGGVSRAGAIAIDANFSEYGDYLQRMFDAISLHWNNLNEDAIRSYAEMRSKVVVEFFIRSDGTIYNLRILNSNADRLRTLFCEEAIRARAPFGEWTKDMKTALGTEQPIRITFFYR